MGGNHGATLGGAARQRFKSSGIENPSDIFTFTEEAQIENGIFAVPLPPGNRWYGNDFPANHHRGVYNLAFADGHAEPQRFMNLDQLGEWGAATQDVQRLQRAIPKER